MSQDGRHLGEGTTPSITPAATPASSPAAPSSPGSCSSQPPSPITLSDPRPEHQRSTNVYVDTPFKHKVSPSRRQSPGGNSTLSGGLGRGNELPLVHGGTPSPSPRSSQGIGSKRSHLSSTAVIKPLVAPNSPSLSGSCPTTSIKTPTLQQKTTSSTRDNQTSSSSPIPLTSTGSSSSGGIILKQPTSLTFTKAWSGREESEGSSIICSWCGKCRCEACTTPRPPPAHWICGDRWLCSPLTTVDLLSCLCIIKGVLYHCGHDSHDEGGNSASDRPCSCSGPDRCLRWTCLTAAAVPLPCLLCYWPLSGVKYLVEKIYQKCTSHGCTCSVPPHSRSLPPASVQSQAPPTPPRRSSSCRSVHEAKGQLLGTQTFFKL